MKNLLCQFCNEIFTPKPLSPITPGSRPISPFYPITRSPSPFPPIMTSHHKKLSGPDRTDQNGPSQEVIQIIESRLQWIDHSFPADDRSLSPSLLSQEPPIRWRRLHDIFPEANLRLFPTEEINISRVRGSPLNSKEHGMVSAFLSLYERHPNILRKIFLTREVNQAGIYELHLCVSGRWKRIVIDDYIPVRYFEKENNDVNSKQNHFEIAFSGLLGNGVFLILLEKAFAKIHRGYGMYNKYMDGPSGLPLAWETFTGLSTETIRVRSSRCRELESKNKLFPKLVSFFKEGHVIGVVTGGRRSLEPPNYTKYYGNDINEDQDSNRVILDPDHKFIISDVSLKHFKIRLQNPCPTVRKPNIYFFKEEEEEEFDDEYDQIHLLGNTSPPLSPTDGIKGSIFGESKERKGFWINWEDALDQIRLMQVCFLRKNWMEKRIKIKPNECVEFEVSSGVGAPCVSFVGGLHQGWKYEGDGLEEMIVPPCFEENPHQRIQKIRDRANSGDSTRPGNRKPVGFILLKGDEVVMYQGMRICSSIFTHDLQDEVESDLKYLRNGKYKIIPIISGISEASRESELVFHFSFHTNASHLVLKKRIMSKNPFHLHARIPYIVYKSGIIKDGDEMHIQKNGNLFKISRYWKNEEIFFMLEWCASKNPVNSIDYLYKFEYEFHVTNLTNVVHCKRNVVIKPNQVILMGWFVREDLKAAYSVRFRKLQYYSVREVFNLQNEDYKARRIAAVVRRK